MVPIGVPGKSPCVIQRLTGSAMKDREDRGTRKMV